MIIPARPLLRPLIPSVLAAVSVCSTASAVVVWSDDFSGYGTPPNFSDPPSRNFPGGAAGNDWSLTAIPSSTFINTSIGSGDNTSLLQDDGDSNAPVAAVYRSQWASTTSLSTSNNILRVSFDMRVAAFLPSSSTDATNPRFILRDTNTTNNNLGIGFGRVEATGALAFYVTNQGSAGTSPTAANAIGLNQPGFNFGTVGTDSFSNGTGGAFIRFSYDYDYNMGTVVGTATNLTTGQSVTFTSSLNKTLDFFNPDQTLGNRDGLILAAGGASQSSVLWDNISVEIIPEPSALLMAFAGAGLLLRRRRAA